MKTLLLIMMIVSCSSTSLDVRDYDMFGNRMAVSDDHLMVLVRNDLRYFFVGFDQFSWSNSSSINTCNVSFFDQHDFIENVAVANENGSFFVYTGEYLDRSNHFIGMIRISSNCVSSYVDRQNLSLKQSSENYDTDVVHLDSHGHFAYVFGWDSSWIYDLTTFQLKKFDSQNDLWHQVFKPIDFVLLDDNQYAVVVGYSFVVHWYFHIAISLVRLIPPLNMTMISNEILLPTKKAIEENDLSFLTTNSLSIAVNHLDQLIIGIPMYNLVISAFVSKTTTNPRVNRTGNDLFWSAGGHFGKSVAWLNTDSFAVLASTAVILPWASSQVLIFDNSRRYSSTNLAKPIFAYPNNQQILDSSLLTPKFIRLYSSKNGHLAVLFNNGHAQLLCVASPGNVSTSFELVSGNHLVIFYTCQMTRCPAGTAKNWSSIGPCEICPSGTKNPKININTDVQCERCAEGSFCPLGSIADIPQDPFLKRISQALTYPESPDATSFDDILLQSMLNLPTKSSKCLLHSPLFWTLLTVGLVFVIVAMAGLCRILPKFMRHYLLITRIFKQTDLIGEGELWIGGLLTFAVVLLVCFTYAFSISYLGLYPIETSSDASFTCDEKLRNAQFSTGFRLTSLHITEEEIPIVDLLNEQELTLSIDLLNTHVVCHDVQIILHVGKAEIPLHNSNCKEENSSSIVSISIPLPLHNIQVSFNISSTSSFIGGLRICLIGPEEEKSRVYFRRSVNFCEFFGDFHQTIGHAPQIDLILTKVINKTEPLTLGELTRFTGLFIPTIEAEGISDQLSFEIRGDYLRYLTSFIILNIDLTETNYFILNVQQPIVRQNELTFHTILFTFAIFELFAFSFLIVKMFVVPLFRIFLRRFYLKNRVESFEQSEK